MIDRPLLACWLVIGLVSCAGPRPPTTDVDALIRQGRHQEARRRLELALEAPAPADERARASLALARVLHDIAVNWGEGGDARALSLVDDARAQAERAGDRALQAAALQKRGEIFYWRRLVQQEGDWDTPRELFQQARALREALGDARGSAESVFYLGLIAQMTGAAAEAQVLFEQSLASVRQANDPLLESYPVRHLASLKEDAGDYDGALRMYLDSLALRERSGDRIRTMNAAITVADVLCDRRRDCAAARPHLERARRTAEELGLRRGQMSVALSLAHVAEWEGDAPRMAAELGRVVEHALALDDVELVVDAQVELAALRVRGGDAASAAEAARAARDALERKKIGYRKPLVLALLAWATLDRGDVAEAARTLAAAWAVEEERRNGLLYLVGGRLFAAARAEAALKELAGRAQLPGDPGAWYEAGLAAARRDRDARAEIDLLLAYGSYRRDAAMLREARALATKAHFPLQGGK